METLAQVAPWVVLFLIFAIVLSLCVFYIKKLIENWQTEKLSAKKSTSSSTTEQRKKIKADILSDLEKKLEAL